MELMINYNPTYEFSTLDYFDAADPPLKFEALTRPPPRWSKLVRDFSNDGANNKAQALEIVSLSIVSVSQNGKKYNLSGIEGAEALRDAVESTNPGMGALFIINLAEGHYNHHFRKLVEIEGNLGKPSPQSDDGSNQNG